MDRRLEFRKVLQEVMGSNKLYFQPPDGTKLTYPCAIYRLQNLDIRNADDQVYKYMKSYQVTIIDSNPDSNYPDILLTKFKRIRFDRAFASDNLNHFVFTIYFQEEIKCQNSYGTRSANVYMRRV